MDINISIAKLFEETFGYKTNAFDNKFNPVAGVRNDSLDPNAPIRKERGDYGTPYYINDPFGREVYLPVTFTYPDNPVVLPDGTIGETVNNTLTLYYAVVGIESKKTIINTQFTERKSPVNEFININGYDITIKGFLINSSNELPEADIKTLVKLYETNSAVTMSCALTDIVLNQFGKQVVIQNLRFPDTRGIKNVKAFEMSVISDEPFNLVDIS